MVWSARIVTKTSEWKKIKEGLFAHTHARTS